MQFMCWDIESGLEFVSQDCDTRYVRVITVGQIFYGAPSPIGACQGIIFELTKNGQSLQASSPSAMESFSEALLLDPNPVGLRIEATDGEKTEIIEIVE